MMKHALISLILMLFMIVQMQAQAQDTPETPVPLIGWRDGVIVQWTSMDSQPTPLYDTDIIIPEIEYVSPDGTHIIFPYHPDSIDALTNERIVSGNGFILYDLVTGEDRVIAGGERTSSQFSRHVVWSPDGGQVAWVRYDPALNSERFTLLLEIYDLVTGEVRQVTDNFYGGYQDGGLNVPSPATWVGDTIVQYSGGYVEDYGDFSDITLLYKVNTGEITIFQPGYNNGIFVVPNQVISARDDDGSSRNVFRSGFGVWFDELEEIAVTDENGDPTITFAVQTIHAPHLRARNAPDDALTFIPYGGGQGARNWIVRYPDGTVTTLDIIAFPNEVYPTPDGGGLLYRSYTDNRWYLWRDDDLLEDTRPVFDATPLWQTSDWFMPTCAEPPRLGFTDRLIAQQNIPVYARPDDTSAPVAEIPAGERLNDFGGALCVNGVSWFLAFIPTSDNNNIDAGWVQEVIGDIVTFTIADE